MYIYTHITGFPSQVWRLSSSDLAEIARNSVLQSSFEPCVKAAWIGRNYRLPGVPGNDISRFVCWSNYEPY